MQGTWLEWIQKNERHLSGVVFLSGFIFDNVSLGSIDVPWVNVLFTSYLGLAALGIFITHYRAGKNGEDARGSRTPLDAIVMLGTQFFLSGLLSGCFIFFFRSATLSVSWPFIVLLGLIFVGSEVLHSYRDQLAFQSAILFLTLYAYSIFELPIILGRMRALVFLESGGIALVTFLLFELILYVVDRSRLLEGIKPLSIGILLIISITNAAYFTGILPPLPLSLKDAGVFHDVTHTGTVYTVEAEPTTNSFSNLWTPEVIHHVPGRPLFVYSAVFAPIHLTTGIVHRWEYYDPQAKKWATEETIVFPISGGRESGYRGYSAAYAIVPGLWRVSIETTSGQLIGREEFQVVDVQQDPVTQTETR